MKKFVFKICIIIFCFTSCHDYKLSWTDKKVNQIWKTIPNDITESIILLDTILSDRVKNQFNATEESFAIVEISGQLGQMFIGGWHMYELSNKSNLTSYFYKLGITDPSEMIRIIFTCYHRKLNNNSYDSQNIIRQYKSYWINGVFYPSYSALNIRIKAIEDSITNKYYFDRTQINDTLSASLFYENNRFSSKPLSYYIETIVINKDTIKQNFSVKLVKASSSNNDSIWYDYKIKRKFGDNFEIRADRFEKKGAHRFRYM